MPGDPLTRTVIDLDDALGCDARLMLGGGFGLYLKQLHLARSDDRTLLPRSRWPHARTTQDIDLFLRAEVVADAGEMARYRGALDVLGFQVDPAAKWLKFARQVEGHRVIVDLMVGPLGDFESRVERRDFRVKPKGTTGVHARAADDALSIDHEPLELIIEDDQRSCAVLIPQAFPFALMKLGALRDRINDQNKDEGRHHALDLFRIVAMLTESEDIVGAELSSRHIDHPVVAEALRVVDERFVDTRGLGRIRLFEHPLCPVDADADWFASELRRLIGGAA